VEWIISFGYCLRSVTSYSDWIYFVKNNTPTHSPFYPLIQSYEQRSDIVSSPSSYLEEGAAIVTASNIPELERQINERNFHNFLRFLVAQRIVDPPPTNKK